MEGARIRKVAGVVFALVAGAIAPPTASAAGALIRSGRWITDSAGRVVVMHGVDIVKKLSPYYPAQFSAADARFLADEGFTAARIGFIWAGAEPAPGVYDDAYIERIIGLADLLAHYGIRPLIDVHQDDWSQRNPDGDGAPGWASLGLTADEDFEDFWDNDAPAAGGVGIETRFVELWSHLVPLIDASPAASSLIGLDPFNEPYPGSGYRGCGDFDPCSAFEETQLYAFYRSVIAAIRGAGYRHVIWPEGIADSGAATPSLPGFDDPQVAFNWHYYCAASQLLPISSGPLITGYCAAGDASAFANLDSYSARLGVPYIVSEFGANDADSEYAHEVDLMGSRFLSWMYWMYYNGGTDPADFPTEGLVLDDNHPGSPANASPAKLDALVEPYAEAIAGTPRTYAFDRGTNTMTLTYGTHAVPGATLARGAETQIFVPQRDYPTGYAVTVTGARLTSAPSSPWVELISNRHATQVSVTVTPRSGGTTELPSETGRVP